MKARSKRNQELLRELLKKGAVFNGAEVLEVYKGRNPVRKSPVGWRVKYKHNGVEGDYSIYSFRRAFIY